MHLSIETEQEEDGRWLSEVPELPGVLAYGATQAEAVATVEALAVRVIAERAQYKERVRRLRASSWVLCRKCRRASKREEWPPVVVSGVVWNTLSQPRHCPYPDCDGRLTQTDDWSRVVRARPQFPDEPERDTVYDFRVVICN